MFMVNKYCKLLVSLALIQSFNIYSSQPNSNQPSNPNQPNQRSVGTQSNVPFHDLEAGEHQGLVSWYYDDMPDFGQLPSSVQVVQTPQSQASQSSSQSGSGNSQSSNAEANAVVNNSQPQSSQPQNVVTLSTPRIPRNIAAAPAQDSQPLLIQGHAMQPSSQSSNAQASNAAPAVSSNAQANNAQAAPAFPEISKDLTFFLVKSNDPLFLKLFKKELGQNRSKNFHEATELVYDETTQKYSKPHRTLLMMAARTNADAVKAVLRYNPNTNRQDMHGDTALHHGVKFGTLASVKLISDHQRTKLRILGRDGLTAPQLAHKLYEDYKAAFEQNKECTGRLCTKEFPCPSHQYVWSDIKAKNEYLAKKEVEKKRKLNSDMDDKNAPVRGEPKEKKAKS
jgi:hypothetical protein